MKKIAFIAKPVGSQARTSADEWVCDKPLPEPTRRFTFDVSLSLHQRIKIACARDDLIMAEVVRELLEQRFPPVRDSEDSVTP